MPPDPASASAPTAAADPGPRPTAGGLWARLLRRRRTASLRTRLLAVGLAPLLLAFPVILTVVLLGVDRMNQALARSLKGNLSGAVSYLEQSRTTAGARVRQLVQTQGLTELLRRPANERALQQWLVAATEGSGLDYLVLATADGRVLASSDGVPRGTRLPDSHVVRQARLGVSTAAYERLTPAQVAALSTALLGHAQPDHGRADLLINAGAHVPLGVDTPDAVLLGGLLLSHNQALANYIRAVIFPPDALPDGAEGEFVLLLDDQVVASATETSPGPLAPGLRLPAAVKTAVLGAGREWLGPLERQGVIFKAALHPLHDGTGQRIGMVGVAFPEAPFHRRMQALTGTVAAVLVLAMLMLSALVLGVGRELSARIRHINSTMNLVRSGQPDARAGLPLREDELGRLTRDFDELLEAVATKDALQRRTNEELQRLSERLSTEHMRLRQVLAGTRAGTWAWNVQTGETEFNERWAEIVGWRLDELLPMSIETWQQRVHPDDLARSDAALQAHFRGETAYYDLELRMRHRDGRWVWVHDRGAVYERTPQGEPLWMSGTHMDITERREATQQRLELLARLQHLSANVPGVLYQYRVGPDGQESMPYASAGIREIYGCSAEDAGRNAAAALSAVHPADRPRVDASIQASAASLQPWSAVYRVRHPERGLRWVAGNATPERDADGGTTWHGYVRDVTEVHLGNERLRLSASVFEASQEGILITDARRRIVDVNPAFTRITGYARDEVLGQRPRVLSSGRHTPDFYAAIDRALAGEGRWQGEMWNRRKNGELYAELLSISAVRDEGGQISHYVSIFTEISGIKAQQSELDRLAHFDALTGIPNRRLLGDRLAQAVAHARRQGSGLAVCMMDLDDFKPVNDTYGHEAGDRLLVEIVRRLGEVVRADETVARLGGDEFVLIFIAPQSDAPFQRVLDAVRRPVALAEATVQVSASLGVAWYRPDISDGDQLLREADQALYASKARGRNCYTVHTSPAPLSKDAA